MKIFKFGGASIKSVAAIKNMVGIISSNANDTLLVVVSAMGKSTNALEQLLTAARLHRSVDIEDFKQYHISICHELFTTDHAVYAQLDQLFRLLKHTLTLSIDYLEHYDATVSIGELISSTIVAAYLNERGVPCEWVDARDYVITSEDHGNGHVIWEETTTRIARLRSKFDRGIMLTQGYIARSLAGKTTTLGREGSDFTAAIFAAALEADSVTVWKDVPGILNGDPKIITDVKLYRELPYKEAAEMTYYGASVIHPKTIKPLALKDIPLYVRSFDDPTAKGTTIHDCQPKRLRSSIIVINNQCLMSFKVIDYTFINEHNLSLIFKEFAHADVKINMMQNSAISFSVVIDDHQEKRDDIITRLEGHFNIWYNTDLTLTTIKNYAKTDVEKYKKGKNTLLEQTSRNNYRILFAN